MVAQRVVDADGHVTEPPDLWSRYGARAWAERLPRIECIGGEERLVVDGKPFMPFPITSTGAVGRLEEVRAYADGKPGGFEPGPRLVDMDAERIDVAVLYPSLGLTFGGLDDAELCAEISRAYNDWITDYCAAAPGRLYAAAIVPLQDPELAAAELRRVGRRDCMRAVMVRPNPYRGRTLDDPAYEAFWRAAVDCDLAIGVHEGTQGTMETVGIDRHPDNRCFMHIISHPMEMQLASLALIAGGVLERHPGLRVVFLEAGGGWMPSWLERMDEHCEGPLYGIWTPWLKRSPSEYFARQCWISFEPGERTLVPLAPLLGSDRIVWGSDYPHPDATFPGVLAKLERTIAPLGAAARRDLLGDSAARLYALDA